MKILASKPIFFLFTMLGLGIPSGGVIYLIAENMPSKNIDEVVETAPKDDLNPLLVYIEANKWVKLNKPWSLPWRRQSHAGMAIDTKRGNLLVFGSDTHNSDWDNSIHEFNPIREKWLTHYIPSDHVNYLLDKNNIAMAEETPPRPRAMHTFDNIVYDSKNDALFVAAAPEHYSLERESKNITHPMWIYQLKNKTWKPFFNNGKEMPSFFAGATSYDPDRDTIVAYRYGIWELGPDRLEWKNATKEYHHEIHFNMEYDSANKTFAVFGNNQLTNVVWSYKPAEIPGNKGEWKEHPPQGDIPPLDEHFPVAYDSKNKQFLLLVDNLQAHKPISETYAYNLSTGMYRKIPGAKMPPLKMNYMMSYDEKHGVFLLVIGNWKLPPEVWAFKLAPEALP